jgi:hypothetical protein
MDGWYAKVMILVARYAKRRPLDPYGSRQPPAEGERPQGERSSARHQETLDPLWPAPAPRRRREQTRRPQGAPTSGISRSPYGKRQPPAAGERPPRRKGKHQISGDSRSPMASASPPPQARAITERYAKRQPSDGRPKAVSALERGFSVLMRRGRGEISSRPSAGAPREIFPCPSPPPQVLTFRPIRAQQAYPPQQRRPR